MRFNSKTLVIFVILVLIFYIVQKWQMQQQKSESSSPTITPIAHMSLAPNATSSAVLGNKK